MPASPFAEARTIEHGGALSGVLYVYTMPEDDDEEAGADDAPIDPSARKSYKVGLTFKADAQEWSDAQLSRAIVKNRRRTTRPLSRVLQAMARNKEAYRMVDTYGVKFFP